MAHEVETMAFAHEVPWHGLGFQVDGNLSPEEMLNAAGLNWRVVKRPTYYRDADGKEHATRQNALIRETDGQFLTMVGDGWNPLQNVDAFKFFKEYCDAGKATMETAGSLRNGKMVWGLANLHHNFKFKDGDEVRGYLMLYNPHEFGKSITGCITTVRVVCANTLRLALNSKMAASFRFSHAKEFDPELAKEAIGIGHEQLESFGKQAELLKKLNLSWDDQLSVLAPVYQPEAEDAEILAKLQNMEVALNGPLNKVMDCLINAPGAEPGTGWGVINAVTYYADHVAGRGQDTRLASSWLGIEGQRKARVMDKLLEMAQ